MLAYVDEVAHNCNSSDKAMNPQPAKHRWTSSRRPETRAKFDRIRQITRWTVAEAMDQAAELLLRQLSNDSAAHGPTPKNHQPAMRRASDMTQSTVGAVEGDQTTHDSLGGEAGACRV
jgi:hypothetical protein